MAWIAACSIGWLLRVEITSTTHSSSHAASRAPSMKFTANGLAIRSSMTRPIEAPSRQSARTRDERL
ncbi:MAG TPA: hypothetical protein VNX29_23175 [Kaistia sp.]|nr:hypothetical protein [Kaistia sp.]